MVLADAGYCNRARHLLELEDRGIDAHVALGREGKSQVAVDPARLPATHRGEKLASPAGKARYAQRKWLSEALAYNLGNFMRTLALPDAVEQWSLTSLREKLIKIGAKIVRHGRYVTFQMAEVVIPRDLFADILRRIDRLRPPPAPA